METFTTTTTTMIRKYAPKRVAVARRRKKALGDMDVDLSTEAKIKASTTPPSIPLPGAATTSNKPVSAPPKAEQATKVREVPKEQALKQQEAVPATTRQHPEKKPPIVLQVQPPRPKREVDNVGVSVYHLEQVFLKEKVQRFRGVRLSGSSTIYDIESAGVIRQATEKTKCPIDGQLGSAYVFTVQGWGVDHVGKATHMLSYSWRYTLRDIVETLNAHCTAHELPTKRTYVWMDCLSNNLHRVSAADKKSSQEFQTSSEDPILGGLGHVLVMMDPFEAPVYLTRTWCLWELYTATTYKDIEVDFLLPPAEKQALKDDLLQELGSVSGLYQALGSTNIQNTEASKVIDKQRFLQIVQEGVGLDAFNQHLVQILRGWMRDLFQEVAIATKAEDGTATTEDQLNHATYCTTIGTIYWDSQEYGEALLQYEKCRDIQMELLGDSDASTAITYNNIGLVKKDMEDYEGALVEFRKCLAIDQASLGANHPAVADSHSNIACTLLDKGDLDEAMAEYQKGLVIQEAAQKGGEEPSLDTGMTYRSIGVVLEAKEDYQAALEMYQKCCAIQYTHFGSNHPNTQATLDTIKSLKAIIAKEEQSKKKDEVKVEKEKPPPEAEQPKQEDGSPKQKLPDKVIESKAELPKQEKSEKDMEQPKKNMEPPKQEQEQSGKDKEPEEKQVKSNNGASNENKSNRDDETTKDDQPKKHSDSSFFDWGGSLHSRSDHKKSPKTRGRRKPIRKSKSLGGKNVGYDWKGSLSPKKSGSGSGQRRRSMASPGNKENKDSEAPTDGEVFDWAEHSKSVGLSVVS